jgi:hypothetical protein
MQGGTVDLEIHVGCFCSPPSIGNSGRVTLRKTSRRMFGHVGPGVSASRMRCAYRAKATLKCDGDFTKTIAAASMRSPNAE